MTAFSSKFIEYVNLLCTNLDQNMCRRGCVYFILSIVYYNNGFKYIAFINIIDYFIIYFEVYDKILRKFYKMNFLPNPVNDLSNL